MIADIEPGRLCICGHPFESHFEDGTQHFVGACWHPQPERMEHPDCDCERFRSPTRAERVVAEAVVRWDHVELLEDEDHELAEVVVAALRAEGFAVLERDEDLEARIAEAIDGEASTLVPMDEFALARATLAVLTAFGLSEPDRGVTADG